MKIIKTTFCLILLINLCFIYPKEKGNVKLRFILYDGLTAINTASIQQKLNDNVDRIMSDLQVNSIDSFRVHIWGNNESYLASQEHYCGRNWPGSTGYVISPNDLGILNAGNIAEVAEHEFAHCISLHLTYNLPRWLWEAAAVYESNEFVNPKTLSYLAAGNYPTINQLNADFSTGARQIYQVGYLLIEYIIHDWGQDKVVELIRSNGNIQSVLNLSISQFEEGWKKFVNNKYFNTTSVSENSINIAQNSLILNHNYPNPFNPETIISYVIGTGHLRASPNPSLGGILIPVNLKVYDILGNEVATLVNEEQAPGKYEVKFNSYTYGGGNFPSGIYFYKISAGNYVQTEKMVILK